MKFLRFIVLIPLTCFLIFRDATAQTVVPANTKYPSGQTQTVTDPTSVSTTGSVTVSSGANIIYSGGTKVELMPGFQALPGSIFHAGVTDADSDGIPYAWEIFYGLNPSANDAAGDLDGDGLTNLQEYQQGTAPNNADRTPPSNPTALAGVLSGPTQITLTWNPSTDTGAGTPGIAGYRIYRNGALLPLALVTNTSFTDTNLASQITYSYTVRSVDVAGNVSGDSGTVPLTTLTNGTTTFGNPQVFNFTGGVQTFTVPGGITSIRAKVWGAGGGAGYDSSHTVPNISASTGGYSQMEWAVQPGNVITVVVGESGKSGAAAPATFGGGAASSQSWSGSGGGRSEISAPAGIQLVAAGGAGGGAGSGAGGGSAIANGGTSIVTLTNNNPSDLDWTNLAGAAGVNGVGGNGRVVLLLGSSQMGSAPLITSASAAQMSVGASGTYQITSTNGPVVYEISGNAPPGMTINAATGQITGTPTQAGNYRFSLKATNNSGTDTRELTLSVVSSATIQFLNTVIFTQPTNYSIPGGQLYDYVRMKVWGAGGGSAPPAYGSALGGQGGFSQMDLNVAGGEAVTAQPGAGGAFGEYYHGGNGGTASVLLVGSNAKLIAGAGGGGGVRISGSVNSGSNGGNGGGANQSGQNGIAITNAGHTAQGGFGSTTTAVGAGGSGYGANGWNPNGGAGVGVLGGTSGIGGTSGYFPGGQGGNGIALNGTNYSWGGGGGAAFDYNYPNGTLVVGTGGGGSGGYASGGFNVIGISNNNSSDPDWGGSAGAPGDAGNTASPYTGYAGRCVLSLGTLRPAVASPSTWSLVLGVSDSYSITTVLNATAYAITSGTLPAGLKLDGRTGIIAGAAAQVGTFNLTLVATNSNGSYLGFPLTIVVSANVASQPKLPLVTGFESIEGYTTGSLAGQNGWTVAQGTANVINTAAQRGAYSVQLAAGATPGIIRRVFAQSAGNPVVFADCYVKLTADTTVGLSRLEVGPSWISLLKNGSLGEVMVCSSVGSTYGNWRSTGLKYALDASNTTTAWVRLTVRQDFTASKWDLYVDGRPALCGLNFADKNISGLTQFALRGHPSGSAFLDSVSITFDNPLFTDADRDGMDDNWEIAYGLNPTVNDRDADNEGDGLTNGQEFFLGIRPDIADTDGDGYTDGQEVANGTDPRVARLNDPSPMTILLVEPLGATPVP